MLLKIAIASAERDGAWCRIPETYLPSLRDQQPKLEKSRDIACSSAKSQAAEIKRQQNEQKILQQHC